MFLKFRIIVINCAAVIKKLKVMLTSIRTPAICEQ